jgi:hypothetical protein
VNSRWLCQLHEIGKCTTPSRSSRARYQLAKLHAEPKAMTDNATAAAALDCRQKASLPRCHIDCKSPWAPWIKPPHTTVPYPSLARMQHLQPHDQISQIRRVSHPHENWGGIVGSFEQAMILHRSEDVVETKALYRQILMKRQVHELPNVWPNDELSDSVIDRFLVSSPVSQPKRPGTDRERQAKAIPQSP